MRTTRYAPARAKKKLTAPRPTRLRRARMGPLSRREKIIAVSVASTRGPAAQTEEISSGID
eukprot:8504858-Pyramimonas_sp.AAC.1